MKLAGKIALITGGASGIGHAIGKGFHEAGARVWLADIAGDAATAAASAIGGGTTGVSLDVTDAPAIERLMETMAESGGIDILVNAAGVYGFEPWLTITPAELQRILAVNIGGLVSMTQAAGARMVTQARGGVIVNIASAAGRRGDPGAVIYSASKAAAISLTQSAALAFAPHGIRVNALAPGAVRTPMWATVLARRASHLGQSSEAVEDATRSRIPLGRVAEPEEQVAAAVFLASADSGYITGQTLNVDGGLFMN